MQTYFYALADFIGSLLEPAEVYTCTLASEDSDFIRFNRSGVRQAGSVHQADLRLDLIAGARHAAAQLGLSGDPEMDRARIRRSVEELRERRACLPEDPLLLYSQEVRSTERRGPNRLPETFDAVEQIEQAGRGRDLVGIYASGGTHHGFANSLGQRNWDSKYSFNLDWSFYHDADKAAKASYTGFEWKADEFAWKVERAAEELHVLGQRPRAIDPGAYRVYLAPGALSEIVDMLRWGGFGLRAHRTKTTPLLKMIEEGARFHGSVNMQENTRDGVAPEFQEAGFLRPPSVTLIDGGAYGETLVSPRSAVEYGVPTNGASNREMPISIEVAGGDMPQDEVLQRLGTGVYTSNLWYLNYSDRSACRTTGMTRFATFWVENGAIQAPLSVMRFDETVFRMLGENLVGLTRERDFILDPGTYGGRSSQSARLPGALVDDFVFTL